MKGKRWFRAAALILAAVWVTQPAVLRADEVVSGPRQAESDNYRLQAGDRLQIKIYPEDEYIKGGETEISSEGNITLPIVGKVAVAEKTVIEAERALTAILTEDYLVEPEVVIEVLQYRTRSFVVLGEVARPGTYDFPPGVIRLTLLQAISLAGGFSEVANIKKIKIIRKTAGGEDVFSANGDEIIRGREPDIVLQAGDVVHVSESLF
jgi:polysaccharide export outer membrane protein